MKKKITVLLLVFVLLVASFGTLVAFTGCSDTQQFKVGVLHINPKDSTSGYTYAHQQGILYAQKELGLSDEQIILKDNVSDSSPEDINAAIKELIAEGCNMIIGTSYGYMDYMKNFAEQYPEIIFSHGTGYKDTFGEGLNNNMNNYFGRIYQVRYLSGLVAGLATETNNIGYVVARGTDTAECTSGVNAFTLGVQAVNPDAKVHVMILNSWFDPNNEKAFADTLIETYNCDVVTQHCDTEGPSLSAKEHGVYSIGYNSDMATAVAEAGVERDPSVLTSVLWNWGAYYKPAIEAAMKCFDEQGNFISNEEWIKFDNYYGDYTDGLYELAALSGNCADDTAEIVALVEAMMAKGTDEWDVFTNKALSFTKGEDGKYTVTQVDRQLMDNTGNAITEVTVANITGNMPYWVAGVEVHNK